MSILPSVRARLAARYVLNFRMPSDVMRRFLPVDWLEPAEIQGFAIASFCVLDLRNITVAPLPALAGLSSLSCAPRYAVTDRSGNRPQPAVFVTERYTNSSFGSWFTSLGFSAPHPYVDATILTGESETLLKVADQGQPLFSARVRDGALRDSLFTPETFAQFISEGVVSYGLSIHGKRLTRVDLHKTDGTYHPLEVVEASGPAIEQWVNAGAVLDSAFSTVGGMYEWSYRGLTD